MFKKLRELLEETTHHTVKSKRVADRSPFLKAALKEFEWIGTATSEGLHEQFDDIKYKYMCHLKKVDKQE